MGDLLVQLVDVGWVWFPPKEVGHVIPSTVVATLVKRNIHYRKKNVNEFLQSCKTDKTVPVIIWKWYESESELQYVHLEIVCHTFGNPN